MSITAKEWNAHVPIGSNVTYFPSIHSGCPVKAKTVSRAWESNGVTVVRVCSDGRERTIAYWQVVRVGRPILLLAAHYVKAILYRLRGGGR